MCLSCLLIQRPEKYLGDIETWEKAEAALTEALNEFGQPWQVTNYSVIIVVLPGTFLGEVEQFISGTSSIGQKRGFGSIRV